jgi:hypothetical protein
METAYILQTLGLKYMFCVPRTDMNMGHERGKTRAIPSLLEFLFINLALQ